MKKLSTLRAATLALALSATAALSACNGDSQAQSVGDDWVNDAPSGDGAPTTAGNPDGTTPTPTPTSTASPSPDLDVRALYDGPDEVEPYVAKFIADAAIQGVDVLPKMKNPKLTIRIASLDAYGSSTIGLCETASGVRRVTFDPDFWNSVSETQRELLAHHELGHCVLYRAHRTATLDDGTYASIMYPIIFSTTTYRNNYDYYQEELFTWSSSSMSSSRVSGSGEMPTETHVCN